jgi:hypothetical protein
VSSIKSIEAVFLATMVWRIGTATYLVSVRVTQNHSSWEDKDD